MRRALARLGVRAGALRVSAVRRALAGFTGITLVAFILRELVMLALLPNGGRDLMLVPVLLMISLAHSPLAVFTGAFPLSLPIFASRPGAVGMLAGLQMGPVAVLGLHWLELADLDLMPPSWGVALLLASAISVSMLSAFEALPVLRSGKRRPRPTSRPRGGAIPASFRPAGILLAVVVWVWSSWPSASTQEARAEELGPVGFETPRH